MGFRVLFWLRLVFVLGCCPCVSFPLDFYICCFNSSVAQIHILSTLSFTHCLCLELPAPCPIQGFPPGCPTSVTSHTQVCLPPSPATFPVLTIQSLEPWLCSRPWVLPALSFCLRLQSTDSHGSYNEFSFCAHPLPSFLWHSSCSGPRGYHSAFGSSIPGLVASRRGYLMTNPFCFVKCIFHLMNILDWFPRSRH